MSRRSYSGPIRPRIRDGCDRGWGTPGHSLPPWHRRVQFVVDARGRTIAHISVTGIESDRRAEANVRAILALPQVLAAAKALLGRINPGHDAEMIGLFAELAASVADAEEGYRPPVLPL